MHPSMEDSARDKNLRLRFEGFGVGTWDLDLETRDLVWPRTTQDLFGVGRDQVVTYELFLSLLEPRDRARIEQEIKTVARTGGQLDVSIKLHDSAGNPQWLRARAGVVDDGSGAARHL